VILKTLILISATYGKALELLKELAELLGYRNPEVSEFMSQKLE
jgi:hypothetical protein